MSNLKGHEIRLKSRPEGMPTEANFEYVEAAVAQPKDRWDDDGSDGPAVDGV